MFRARREMRLFVQRNLGKMEKASGADQQRQSEAKRQDEAGKIRGARWTAAVFHVAVYFTRCGGLFKEPVRVEWVLVTDSALLPYCIAKEHL